MQTKQPASSVQRRFLTAGVSMVVLLVMHLILVVVLSFYLPEHEGTKSSPDGLAPQPVRRRRRGEHLPKVTVLHPMVLNRYGLEEKHSLPRVRHAELKKQQESIGSVAEDDVGPVVAAAVAATAVTTPVHPDAPAHSNRTLPSNVRVHPDTPAHSNNQTLPDNVLHVWMHIPKTGGTTAYDSYMRALGGRNQSVFPPIPILGKKNCQHPDWTAPGCMLGPGAAPYGASHCTWSEIGDCLRTHDTLPRVPTPDGTTIRSMQHQLYTIVRDPVERVLSEFFWWHTQNHTVDAWTDSMYQNRNNLTAWVLDDTNVAHNRQTLYFLMRDQAFPVNMSECIHMMGNGVLHTWIVKHFGSIAGLNAAFGNTTAVVAVNNNKTTRISTAAASAAEVASDRLLEQFFFVAVLELPDLAHAAFERMVGIPPLPPPTFPGVKNTNVKLYKDFLKRQQLKLHNGRRIANITVTDRIRRWIHERNQLDRVLYQQAVKRLMAVVE